MNLSGFVLLALSLSSAHAASCNGAYEIWEKFESKGSVLSTPGPARDPLYLEAHCKDGTYAGYLERLHREIYSHSEKMLDERERSTGYFHWGRLRYALESTPTEVLSTIFNAEKGGLSKQEFYRLYWAVKTGGIKTSPMQEKMVDEIYHLSRDVGKKFWETEDQAFHILAGARRKDERAGFSGEASVAAEFTEDALTRTEAEILARAIGEGMKRRKKYENTKWTDRIAHWWKPHYYWIKRLLSHNNELRRSLEMMYLADEPVIDALERYAHLNFSPEHRSALHRLTADTAEKLSDVRAEIERLYGRELSSEDPLIQNEIRLRDIKKRLETPLEIQDSKSIRREAERDMDVLEAALADARVRSGLDRRRPMEEYHDTHLKIRFRQHIRETEDRMDHYLEQTDRAPRDSVYDCVTKWKVHEEHSELRTRIVVETVSDGKGGTTTRTRLETYTHYWSETHVASRRDTLHVKYEEVLTEEMTPNPAEVPPGRAYNVSGKSSYDSSTVGEKWIASYDVARTDAIIATGTGVRASENPHRNRLREAEEELDAINERTYPEIRDDWGKRDPVIRSLDATRRELVRMKEELIDYLKTDEAALERQWELDKHEDFMARNESLLARYDHLIKRLDHVREQVHRQIDRLDIHFEVPNWSHQLAELKDIHDRIRRRQAIAGGAAGTAAAGGAAAYFGWPEETQQFIDSVRTFFGF